MVIDHTRARDQRTYCDLSMAVTQLTIHSVKKWYLQVICFLYLGRWSCDSKSSPFGLKKLLMCLDCVTFSNPKISWKWFKWGQVIETLQWFSLTVGRHLIHSTAAPHWQLLHQQFIVRAAASHASLPVTSLYSPYLAEPPIVTSF